MWVLATLQLLLMLGLAPFVLSALEMSQGEPSTPGSSWVEASARLGVRLLVHPSAMQSHLVLVAGLLGAAGLLALAAWAMRSSRTLRKDADDTGAVSPLALIGMTCLLGLAAPMGLAVLAPSFDVLRLSYNSWIVAPLYLLISAGVGVPSVATATRRGLRDVSLLAMITAAMLATVVTQRNPSNFTHGISGAIRSVVDAGEANVVIHTAQWGHSYFPTFFAYGDALHHIAVEEDARLVTLPSLKRLDTAIFTGAEVVSVACRDATSAEILDYLKTGHCELPIAPDPNNLLALPSGKRWILERELRHVSYLAGVVQLWRVADE
jgi:hypothetical protein